jgi:A/G-specific adenine glycosylase
MIDPNTAPPDKVTAVQAGLLAWFAANRRDLPWRHTRDPYAVLVSEVMLQQTQVDRVIPYYTRWLDAFPTVDALADAPTADVIRLWSGLGYNRRAVNLQRTAQAVVNEHDGEFPRTVDALRALPGIGPYTAGAIAAFAFEQDVGFIDTNMRRVLHRLFYGVEVPTALATDRALIALAETVVTPGRGWTWNQALIEFGALHCTARRPACVVCPLQRACAAYPAIQTAIKEIPVGTRLKREGTWEGSNRQARGRIVDTLRQHPALLIDDLGGRIRPAYTEQDRPWLYDLVRALERDGLAKVAEEDGTYVVELP